MNEYMSIFRIATIREDNCKLESLRNFRAAVDAFEKPEAAASPNTARTLTARLTLREKSSRRAPRIYAISGTVRLLPNPN